MIVVEGEANDVARHGGPFVFSATFRAGGDEVITESVDTFTSVTSLSIG